MAVTFARATIKQTIESLPAGTIFTVEGETYIVFNKRFRKHIAAIGVLGQDELPLLVDELPSNTFGTVEVLLELPR